MVVYVVILRTTCYKYVTSHSTCIIDAWGQCLTSLGPNQYNSVLFIQASEHQAVGPYLVRTMKPPSHPQVSVYCLVKSNLQWMCCYLFHKLRNVKPRYHPHGGVCCYIKNHRPWICHHSFLIYYGCMLGDNVLQYWDQTNVVEFCS